MAGLTRISTLRRGCCLGALLAIAFVAAIKIASGQGLRQALELQLAGLAAKSHSAILLWDLPKQEGLAAVGMEVFTTPRCLGSLVKPFVLLAYLNEHCRNFTLHASEVSPSPRVDNLAPCLGHVSDACPIECWYKPGHGTLDMSSALAFSCNQYFYQLAKQISPEAFIETLTAQSLSPSNNRPGVASIRPETMIGLDSNLKLVPLRVLKAYAALISGHPSPGAGSLALPDFHFAILINGLRLGASEGTSALAQRALPPNHHLLGKTGTSPAFVGGQYLKSRTDGWFLGFYPAAQPVLAVMVYYPGGLGARDAAPLGGQAIRTYLEMVR